MSDISYDENVEVERLIQEFKDNAFKAVLEELKSTTSWRDKNNFDEALEKSGWNGPFTYLKKYYDGREYEFVETVKLLWNEIY